MAKLLNILIRLTVIVLVILTIRIQNVEAVDCFLHDNDYDGYSTFEECGPIDCDDNDPLVNPGMREIAFNGIDDDCNPDTPDDCEDYDQDGYGTGPGCSGEDCDDYNADINPGASEAQGNCKDDDCNPETIDEGLMVGDWFVECIDTFLCGNPNVSLSIDPADSIHVSLSDYLNYKYIRYVTNSSGIWTADNVSSGKGSSMAADLSGAAHIIVVTYAGLFHVTNTSGSWESEIVESSGTAPKIAIDSQANVHAIHSFYNGVNYDLRYTTNETGNWITETISNSSYNSAMALDSKDNVHIVYYDKQNGALMHVTNESGTWANEIIISTSYKLHFISIALDSYDNVHISFTESSENLFTSKHMYATNKSGSWAIEDLNAIFGTDGWNSSIAIDKFNNVHISTKERVSGLVHYFTNASGIWEMQIVDIYLAKDATAIAVDSLNDIHISYYELYSGLKHAYLQCPYYPVRIAEETSGFDRFHDAYAHTTTGDTIQIRDYVFDEDLVLDGNKNIFIEAGYSCRYLQDSGETTINGNMIVSNGSLTIQNGVVILQ